MINRICTRLRQFREQAELHRTLRTASPATRAELWPAADRYLSQRPSIGVSSLSQYPLMRPLP
jgi:hypothetical protein